MPREGVKIMDFQEAVFKNCLEISRDAMKNLVSGNSKGNSNF
jgi:hypothetical protein